MRIVWAMVWAHVLQTLRSRRALFAMFVMPMGFIAILSMALSNVINGQVLPSVRLIVVNEDTGAAGKALTQFLQSQSGIAVKQGTSLDDARGDIARGAADVMVAIPAGFSAALVRGGPAEVKVDAPGNKRTAQSLVALYVKMFGTQWSVGEKAPPPVHFQPTRAPSTRVTAGTYSTLGMMTMFMLMQAFNQGEALVAERDTDRWRRLAAAPIAPSIRLCARALAVFVTLLLQGALLLLAGQALFGARLGPVGWSAVLLISYAAALTGVALLLARVFRSPGSLGAISVIGANVMAALGGSFTPVSNFPALLQPVARVVPNGVMMQAAMDCAMGADWTSDTRALVVLWAFALVCGGLTLFRWKRRAL